MLGAACGSLLLAANAATPAPTLAIRPACRPAARTQVKLGVRDRLKDAPDGKYGERPTWRSGWWWDVGRAGMGCGAGAATAFHGGPGEGGLRPPVCIAGGRA